MQNFPRGKTASCQKLCHIFWLKRQASGRQGRAEAGKRARGRHKQAQAGRSMQSGKRRLRNNVTASHRLTQAQRQKKAQRGTDSMRASLCCEAFFLNFPFEVVEIDSSQVRSSCIGSRVPKLEQKRKKMFQGHCWLPQAPQGPQFAFLQMTPRISQSESETNFKLSAFAIGLFRCALLDGWCMGCFCRLFRNHPISSNIYISFPSFSFSILFPTPSLAPYLGGGQGLIVSHPHVDIPTAK